MGIYCSKPIMEMDKIEGMFDKKFYCSCSVQGWRKGQEDSFVTVPDYTDNLSLFGIFDGHGGYEVSKFSATKLPDFLKKNKNFECGNYKKAFQETFLEFDRYLRSEKGNNELLMLRADDSNNIIDETEDIEKLIEEASLPLEELIKEYNISERTTEKDCGDFIDKLTEEDNSEDDEEVNSDDLEESESSESEEYEYVDETPQIEKSNEAAFDCGTTAVVGLLSGDKLTVANVGDSRCIMSRKGVCVSLSEDHKPDDEKESQRILKAGSEISNGRIDNGLNLSRALGDWRYKEVEGLELEEQAITSLPDVVEMTLVEDDEFMVMGTDGIWNSVSNQEVISYMRHYLINGVSPSDICNKLFNCVLAENTDGDGVGCDNMTCTVVLFKNQDYFTSLPPTTPVVINGCSNGDSDDGQTADSSPKRSKCDP